MGPYLATIKAKLQDSRVDLLKAFGLAREFSLGLVNEVKYHFVKNTHMIRCRVLGKKVWERVHLWSRGGDKEGDEHQLLTTLHMARVLPPSSYLRSARLLCLLAIHAAL